MGKTQSTLEQHGYTIQSRAENSAVATSKGGDWFVIREIQMSQVSSITQEFNSEIEILQSASHPHIVDYRNSFQDENCHYVVMDHCQGGHLAQKIKDMSESGQMFEEDQVIFMKDTEIQRGIQLNFQLSLKTYHHIFNFVPFCKSRISHFGTKLFLTVTYRFTGTTIFQQILQWIVQTCMALKHIHEIGLLHKDLTPQRIFLTEFGTICLGGFGKLSENTATKSSLTEKGDISYLSPETLTTGMYDSKSDVWSLGCVLYELCTLELAFTAETTIRLIPKILDGPYPSLPERFTPELHQLLTDIFQKEPRSRPTASEILRRPFVIRFLSGKSKSTTEELQANLDKLRVLADGLETVHQRATVGSLTGGVIGAAGGITSIVGLILSPFTLGASLVVTGVGIGVAVVGGATAGISNITNMVNQSSDRQAIRGIVREFSEKMSSVVTSLGEITEGLEELGQNVDSPEVEGCGVSSEKLKRLGARAGRGLGGIAELVRLVQVVRLGKVAAQTAKVVRVAEVATGVLSAFFVAVDVFFIAMDAKEIHHIREARAAETAGEMSRSRLILMETDSAAEPQSDPGTEKIKSETMKFVQSIRQTVEKLQEFVDELSEYTSLVS